MQAPLLLAAALFAIGLYGVLTRRNAVLIIMAIELMLNAVNINLLAFSAYLAPDAFTGQVFAVFVICIAAAEAGLALAILLRLFRNRATVDVEQVDSLRW